MVYVKWVSWIYFEFVYRYFEYNRRYSKPIWPNLLFSQLPYIRVQYTIPTCILIHNLMRIDTPIDFLSEWLLLCRFWLFILLWPQQCYDRGHVCRINSFWTWLLFIISEERLYRMPTRQLVWPIYGSLMSWHSMLIDCHHPLYICPWCHYNPLQYMPLSVGGITVVCYFHKNT